MSFCVTHVYGDMERDIPTERFSALLDELELGDDEHFGVSVTHETDWCLSVYGSGVVVLEHLEAEAGGAVHAGPLERDEVIGLMVAIAEGRIEEVRRSRTWRPGYY